MLLKMLLLLQTVLLKIQLGGVLIIGENAFVLFRSKSVYRNFLVLKELPRFFPIQLNRCLFLESSKHHLFYSSSSFNSSTTDNKSVPLLDLKSTASPDSVIASII